MATEYTEWKRRYPREGEAAEIIENADGRPITLILSIDDYYHPMPPDKVNANANLIVSAVNACIKLNPENPQAVAEGIAALYEALKRLLTETSILDNEECDHDVGICWCSCKNARFVANHILAKVEGKRT